MADSIERRAMKWLCGSDTGSSSKVLCRNMLGLQTPRVDHPYDPDDLGRCLRLLDQIPEWKARISEMGALSAYWRALAARWDDLAQSMADEVGADWSKGRKAPATYALMRSLLDPIADADSNVIRFGRCTISGVAR